MALLSLPVCLLAQEWFAIAPFLITAGISAGLGQLLYCWGRKAEHTHYRQAMITVALGWGIVPLLGALPLWLIAQALGESAGPTVSVFQNGWNAAFEGMSGFTSAGLTMSIQESLLPASLQWWRSFMQWVGGVGVIVLMLALLEPGSGAYQLYSAEGRQQRIGLTVHQTVRRIWWIYALFTLAGMILFRVVGMDWWAALNHSMTAISTGGFSITDNSMGDYDVPIKIAVMVMMVMGAIAFSNHDRFLRQRQLSAYWQDEQHRLLWVLLLLGAVFILFEQYATSSIFHWTDSLFQWVSALTTCGFGSESVQFWSDNAKLLLSLGMIVGGAAGSTVGGIKLSRAAILIKAVGWRFERTVLQPHEMMRYWIDDRPKTEAEASRQINSAAVLLVLWLLLISCGVSLLLRLVPAEYTLSDVIFEAASALGSAGLSTGITGPTLHWSGKLTLMLLMWMGRLEVVPVMVLLALPLRRLTNTKR
ncbi:MAG: TrkH family potassium uptake protein [Leptolyngbya sp. SIO4C1]|nr:TrkH family potassium uptake protein [Leptolyngbya sp. SIO4C1]